MVAFVKKEKNSEHSIAIHSISKAGYVTAVLAIVCTAVRDREASNVIFEKLPLAISIYFTLF